MKAPEHQAWLLSKAQSCPFCNAHRSVNDECIPPYTQLRTVTSFSKMYGGKCSKSSVIFPLLSSERSPSFLVNTGTHALCLPPGTYSNTPRLDLSAPATPENSPCTKGARKFSTLHVFALAVLSTKDVPLARLPPTDTPSSSWALGRLSSKT